MFFIQKYLIFYNSWGLKIRKEINRNLLQFGQFIIRSKTEINECELCRWTIPIAGLNLNHFSDFQINIKKCLELMIQIWTLDIFMSAKNFDTLFKIDRMRMLSLNPSKTHKQFSLQYWVTDSFEKEWLQRGRR